jgi:hypothetical protein
MKTFMKSVIVSATLIAAGAAYAQFPPTIGCGDYRVAQGNSCTQAGAVVYNHSGYPTNARVGGGNGVVVFPVIGGGYQKCEVVGAGIGATLGSLNTEHPTQATLLGMFIGGLIGNAVCTDSNNQRVVVQGQGQNGERFQSGSTVTVRTKCEFGNGVTAYVDGDQSGCARLASLMTKTVPASTARSSTPVANATEEEPTLVQGRNCAYKLNGKVMVDYFKANGNDEGIVLPAEGAGPRCRELLQKFIAKKGYPSS